MEHFAFLLTAISIAFLATGVFVFLYVVIGTAGNVEKIKAGAQEFMRAQNLQVLAYHGFNRGSFKARGGIEEKVNRGARIVFDESTPRGIKSPKVKGDMAFVELVQRIRRDAFNPEYLQDVSELSLKHPDSFITIDPNLIKKKP